jgi:hypothetical protein
MGGMINPVLDRAPGVVPRFVTSETEKVLGIHRNQFRELHDRYSPNCYCIRYDCQRCGMYVWFVPRKPDDIPQFCHYCLSDRVSIDGCDGWTNLPLPNLSKPMRLGKPLIPKAEKVTQVCEWCNKRFTIPKRTKKQRCCSQKCGAQRHKHIKAMEGK